MAAVLVILKAILEIAGFALLAQGLVGVFSWRRRRDNPLYRLFALVASPFTRLVRRVTPQWVVDQHIPLATFLLLGFAWLFVVLELRASCIAEPTQRACPVLNPAASR
ncbi:MAG: hypothetical protein RR101_07720 [Burkholderiaceae bacterium]